MFWYHVTKMAEEKYSRLPDPDVVKDDEHVIKVYKRRWYTVTLFSLFSFTQALIWNTWGPISDSATLVFNWNMGNIANMANIGNAAYALAVLGGVYILDDIGE